MNGGSGDVWRVIPGIDQSDGLQGSHHVSHLPHRHAHHQLAHAAPLCLLHSEEQTEIWRRGGGGGGRGVRDKTEREREERRDQGC